MKKPTEEIYIIQWIKQEFNWTYIQAMDEYLKHPKTYTMLYRHHKGRRNKKIQ